MRHYADSSLTVHIGDCRAVMAEMSAESVHCVVTSPPYWGLRDYGTATWDGGGWECGGRHDPIKADPDWWDKSGDEIRGEIEAETVPPDVISGDACPTCEAPRCDHQERNNANKGSVNTHAGRVSCRCGARRIDAQLGLEPTPEEYVAAMVDVFREVRRVLRDDGTVWLNLGDSYASSPAGNTTWNHGAIFDGRDMSGHHTARRSSTVTPGLKPKDLVGIPWRVAFALQADGWYLRSDIIWSKPNPMPESVTDRPTKSHEYLFLLSKSPRYFFDADAVREEGPTYIRKAGGFTDRGSGIGEGTGGQDGRRALGFRERDVQTTGRNLRSVWTIATQPYPGAHFATFPEKLVEPCVKAGTSERGVCPECGAPWVRESVTTTIPTQRIHNGRYDASSGFGKSGWLPGRQSVETTGWRPTCDCLVIPEAELAARFGNGDRYPLDGECEIDGRICRTAEPVPATVLDPFAGSGTVGRVANRLGRRAVLIDLSADYIDQAMGRNAQAPLGLGA